MASHVQLTFGGAVNAQAPAHLIPDDTVQTATNVDFGLERGAARVRRGYLQRVSSPFNHLGLFKSYSTDISASVEYTNYFDQFLSGQYGVIRGTLGGAYTVIVQGSGINDAVGFGRYRDNTYIAAAPVYLKDDGTTTTDWIKQRPGAPSVVINSSTALTIGNGTYTIQEGTNSAGLVQIGTATATGDPASPGAGRVTFTVNGIGSPSDFDHNGTASVGDLGVHYVDLAFSDPSVVFKISMDFSIGDATFTTYYHASFQPNTGTNALSAAPDLNALINAQLATGTGTATALTEDQKAQLQSIADNLNVSDVTDISRVGGIFGGLALPRTSFRTIGDVPDFGGGSPWEHIFAVRYVIESTTDGMVVQLRNPRILGAAGFPLNDLGAGYTWWQTWATAGTDGKIIDESAPSEPFGPFRVQNANASVTSVGSPSGSHGITHIITYRQGGFAQDAYAVGTQTLGAGAFLDQTSDIAALSLNIPMVRNIYSRDDIPTNIVILAPESWYDRMFMAGDNVLHWSLPGKPSQIPKTNSAVVSNSGDHVQGIEVWPPGIVIINRDSVYEMYGNVFEGANTDYVLQRTGIRRGSVAPRTIIKTPYGIPLVSWDGMTMYIPGQGVDKNIDWITEAVGDMWRGAGPNDPAALNGSRVPAVNGYVYKASAAYAEGKIYLSVATGTSSTNDTTFVFDFIQQKVWWYQYFGLQPNDLYWDFLNNTLVAAGMSGLYQIESGPNDAGTPITWSMRTKAWSAPSDTITENLMVEYTGGTHTATALYDGTSSSTVGTFTSAVKAYTIPTFGGTLQNNLTLGFGGTSGNAHTALYAVGWDTVQQPARVHFYREDYFDNGSPDPKLWDVFHPDLAILSTGGTSTGTVTAVTFVDNVAVMTNTITATGTPSGGRNIYSFAFPAETYGGVVHSTYTSAQTFKLWPNPKVYEARTQPAAVNYAITDRDSMDENILDGWDVDLNPNGTVFGTLYVDNVAQGTIGTFTGTKRQSYTTTVRAETYGRTVYVVYTGTGFTHYNTWYHKRPEPDRWSQFHSPKISTPTEHHFDNYWVDINPFGNTVTCTAMVDGVAVQTDTIVGTGSATGFAQGLSRGRRVFSLPPETYGKTTWVRYNTVQPSGTETFKRYDEGFQGDPEPDRTTSTQEILPPTPSNHNVKTWIAELNPLGTCTGSLMADGAVIAVQTFVGTIRQTYNFGIDESLGMLILTGAAMEARYSAPQPFKHYRTSIESEPKPFGKTSWAVTYKRPGGASQLDFARFWDIDIEPVGAGTATVTSIWDIDGVAFTTNTFFVSTRTYMDRIPFPPGGRGYLFQQRIRASGEIRVWRSNLDTEHVGVKGLARVTYEGTPKESPYSVYKYA